MSTASIYVAGGGGCGRGMDLDAGENSAKGQNLIRIGWTCAFATAISETSLWVHGLRWVKMSLRLSGRSRIGRPLVLSSLSGCAHALDRLKRRPVATGLSLGPMDDVWGRLARLALTEGSFEALLYII